MMRVDPVSSDKLHIRACLWRHMHCSERVTLLACCSLLLAPTCPHCHTSADMTLIFRARKFLGRCAWASRCGDALGAAAGVLP